MRHAFVFGKKLDQRNSRFIVAFFLLNVIAIFLSHVVVARVDGAYLSLVVTTGINMVLFIHVKI